MSRIQNPPHPGATLSRVLNERAAISPAMALRLEGWLGVARGGRAGLWGRAAGRVRPVAGAQGRGAEGKARTTGT